MKKSRLIKELSIGVASLALVAPLVLGGMQSTPVHAESWAQAYRDLKESEDNTPASAKAQSAKLGDELEKTEDKNEIHLVRTDPGEAYIDAQDLATLSPAVRKVVKVVYPRDVKKDLVPQLNGHYLHRRHHARKHGRRNARAKKHVTRKHRARKHTVRKRRSRKNKYGDDKLPTADQVYNYEMKHDKQYRDAEHYESADFNRGQIHDMKSDPSIAYGIMFNAFNEHEHVNHNVLRHAELTEKYDIQHHTWNGPAVGPEWTHRGYRYHPYKYHARKHVARKHSKRSHKRTARRHARRRSHRRSRR